MSLFLSAYSDSVLKALLDQRLYIVSLGHLVYILLHSEFIRVKMNSFLRKHSFFLCYINFQFSSGALCKLIPDLFLCTASAENCRLLQEPQIQNYLKLCLQMFPSGYFLALHVFSAPFRSLSSYYLSMHTYIHASPVMSRAETLSFFTTRELLTS